MTVILKRLEVGAELVGRADRVMQKLTGLSKSQIRGLFDHNCVTLNGAPCPSGGAEVSCGDVVEARYDMHRRYHERPRAWEDDTFKIIWEDPHLIVIDKAAGALTVPAVPGDTNTVMHAISRYFEHSGLRERAQVVHRLDRDVSGLLVFAKSRKLAEQLQSQFEERKPEREYEAIAHGVMPSHGTFESYLATTKGLKRYTTQRRDIGQLAITHFELRGVAHGASWLKVWLETGRRNQIRVHLADAGHPVLGDPRYRPDLSGHPQWNTKRLALHAAVLGFSHPITKEPLHFVAPTPAAMRSFIGPRKSAGPK